MAAQPGIDERAVSQLWERQAFDPAGLAASGLRVLFRGSPSDAGGPDYQDAMLVTTDQQLITGDVEFHVRSGDWFRHGHHRDARYNGVVLHVVWQDEGPRARRQDGTGVPTLVLSTCSHFKPGPYFSSLEHPCVAAFARLSAEEVQATILASGRLRFEQRTESLAADLTATDPDQVLYTALLEACGYASNRQAFRALAEAAPYAWVRSLPKRERLAGLLAAASLGPEISGVEPPAILPAASWRLVRLRPANQPARRLAGVAALLERHGPRLAQSLVDIVCSVPPARALRSALLVTTEAGAIGAGRADEIAASVVLPFVAACGHPEAAWSVYSSYPSPPHNRWTRRMAGMLREAGHAARIRSAVEHQGIHFQYHRYCRMERATGCPACSGSATRPHAPEGTSRTNSAPL